MNNEPVAYAMFKDGEFYDAIHPKQYTEHIGSYTIPLYTHLVKENWKCSAPPCKCNSNNYKVCGYSNYTHTVKELTVPDKLIDPKSYYIGYEDGKNKSQADIEYEADKAYWRNRTLTDEEITELANEYLCYISHEYEVTGIYKFARAILRKAQEK